MNRIRIRETKKFKKRERCSLKPKVVSLLTNKMNNNVIIKKVVQTSTIKLSLRADVGHEQSFTIEINGACSHYILLGVNFEHTVK